MVVVMAIYTLSFSGKGNGCDHGQIPCSPFDKGGLVVVVMAIYHTFLFGGREVVVVFPSSCGLVSGCDNGQIPCSPFDKGGLVLVVMAIYHTFLFWGKGSGGGDPFLFWDREWL